MSPGEEYEHIVNVTLRRAADACMLIRRELVHPVDAEICAKEIERLMIKPRPPCARCGKSEDNKLCFAPHYTAAKEGSWYCTPCRPVMKLPFKI